MQRHRRGSVVSGHSNDKNFVEDPVNGPRAAIVASGAVRNSSGPSTFVHTGNGIYEKLLAVLVAGLFTAGAFAQAPAAALPPPLLQPLMTAQAAAPATNKVARKDPQKVAKKKTAHKTA